MKDKQTVIRRCCIQLSMVWFGLLAVVHTPVSLADALPDGYWSLPISSQGEPQDHWSGLERSLKPESCGQCHVQQYRDWRTTLHASAMSPGLLGQLLNFDVTNTASCLKCHAPLDEQQQDFERHRSNDLAHKTQGLATSGIICATCHVRKNNRHGPPQRGTGLTGKIQSAAPHGGVLRSADFEQSTFCAACHQFPQAFAINGKPLQNTLVEWQQSPAARQGKSCQSCHMPDRRHLWRGIHDKEMVKQGLTARFQVDDSGASFHLTNSAVGHAFPTYVTPKVWMKAVALDADNRPLPDTEVAQVIHRHVESVNGEWVERYDTRLLPEETVSLTIAWGKEGKAHGRVRFWLEVHPDDFYDHAVYDALIQQHSAKSHTGKLLRLADSRAQSSHYRLFESEVDRP